MRQNREFTMAFAQHPQSSGLDPRINSRDKGLSTSLSGPAGFMIQKGLSNLPILVQIPDLASLPAQPAVAEKQPPPKEERYTAPKTSAPEEKQNIPSTRLIGHRLSAKILALAGILLISAAVGPMLWNHKAKEKPTEESLVEWQNPTPPRMPRLLRLGPLQGKLLRPLIRPPHQHRPIHWQQRLKHRF